MGKQKDIIGKALIDYHFHKEENVITIHSPDFEKDNIAVKWYFRSYKQMPAIEKAALKLCKGKILDLGAGAGSHSHYLHTQGKDVTAVDISEGACKVISDRGIPEVFTGDIYSLPNQKFDTILMMMNGIGITASLDGLEKLLDFLPQKISQGGQLIFDSSDLIYLFQDNNGVARININDRYYGEIDFQMEYKSNLGEPFKWLYVDFDTVSYLCEKRNLKIELLEKGENMAYLARILF